VVIYLTGYLLLNVVLVVIIASSRLLRYVCVTSTFLVYSYLVVIWVYKYFTDVINYILSAEVKSIFFFLSLKDSSSYLQI